MGRKQVNRPCPCGTGVKYKRCCGRFHRGAPPPDAECLMRSRYAAYAVADIQYIIKTTDPGGDHWNSNQEEWNRDLNAFCESTQFIRLTVLNHEPGTLESFVTFRSELMSEGRDAGFTERSRFRSIEGRWLYHSGTFLAHDSM